MNIQWTLVAAVCKGGGIGYQGKLPWERNNDDMKWFRDLTQTTKDPNKINVVVMGRKTFDSIGRKCLPGRWNVVLSRSMPISNRPPESQSDRLSVYNDFWAAMGVVQTQRKMIENIFIIGGAEIYNMTINLPQTHRLFITHFKKKYQADVFFPMMKQSRFKISRMVKETEDFQILEYQGLLNEIDGGSGFRPIGEYYYLDSIRAILRGGNERIDRTGVGTISLFAQRMSMDLSGGQIPLLTTKRTFWKGIVEELLWFMRGDTNVKHLQEKGVHIWDGNSNREFLDGRGLKRYAEGDIGPTYGFNFRHFGAEYQTCETDYSGKGIDQVREVLRLIREEPTSRRIIITLWNPLVQHQMALPPCLYNYQFYVHNGKLSCATYQRSGDMGLGVPFNLASASLLTHMLAKLSGLEAYELIHHVGDAHIYKNHVEALKEQCQRTPRPFPLLEINPNKTFTQIEDFEASDFKIIGYDPYPLIKMDMAV